MKKSKSFSAYGKYLEVRATLTTNPDVLMRNTQRAQENPMKVTKTEPKWIQGFDRLTGRSRPSPFQVFNTKDFCNQANYELKEDIVRTRSSFYPVRKQKQQRLNKLIYNREYERGTKNCKKLPNPQQKNEHIVTTRDLQNFRKSHHSMDFQKQSDRKNTYIKKPVANQNIAQTHGLSSTIKTSDNSLKQMPVPKLSRVHSFDSYTTRDFLSEKKLSKKGAPFYSGAQSFKIPMEKFKGGWKVVGQQEFSKSPKKSLSRYDATNDPFYTKLGYHSKQQLVTKKSPLFDISQQTPRQINEVRSKYPIRLAI